MALSPQYKRSAAAYTGKRPGDFSLPQPAGQLVAQNMPPPMSPEDEELLNDPSLDEVQDDPAPFPRRPAGIAPSRKLHDIESEPQYDDASAEELLDIGVQDPQYQRSRYQDFLEDLRKRSEERFNKAHIDSAQNQVGREDIEGTRDAAQTRNMLGGLSQAFGQVSNVQGKAIESSLPETFKGMNQADQEYLRGRQDLYKSAVAEEQDATQDRLGIQNIQEEQFKNDPTSPVSAAARDFASRLLKKPIDEDVSATQLEKMFPTLAGMFRAESANELKYKQLAQKAAEGQQAAEAKATKATDEADFKRQMLGLKKQEVQAKLSKQEQPKAPKPLGAEEMKRYDSAQMASTAVADMTKAFEKGVNTFSLIGDNEFTEARRRFEEGLGRMQSGGAISKTEEERFMKMVPTAADSKATQELKLRKMKDEMSNRLRAFEGRVPGREPAPAPEPSGHQQIKTYSPGSIPVAD